MEGSLRLEPRLFAALVLLVAACISIAPYSHAAYEQATAVMAQAMIVMDGIIDLAVKAVSKMA